MSVWKGPGWEASIAGQCDTRFMDEAGLAQHRRLTTQPGVRECTVEWRQPISGVQPHGLLVCVLLPHESVGVHALDVAESAVDIVAVLGQPMSRGLPDDLSGAATRVMERRVDKGQMWLLGGGVALDSSPMVFAVLAALATETLAGRVTSSTSAQDVNEVARGIMTDRTLW